MQKHFSFGVLLLLGCCLGQLSLRLKIQKALKLLADAFCLSGDGFTATNITACFEHAQISTSAALSGR